MSKKPAPLVGEKSVSFDQLEEEMIDSGCRSWRVGTSNGTVLELFTIAEEERLEKMEGQMLRRKMEFDYVGSLEDENERLEEEVALLREQLKALEGASSGIKSKPFPTLKLKAKAPKKKAESK